MSNMRDDFIRAGFFADEADWDRFTRGTVDPVATYSGLSQEAVTEAFYSLLTANGMDGSPTPVEPESDRARALRLRRERGTGPALPGMDGRRRT